MCGFVTIVTAPGQRLEGATLSRTTDVLTYRGPDDRGFAWVDPSSSTIQTAAQLSPHAQLSGVLFGHRRLSILDLTSAGHQPIVSDEGLSLLTFNGASVHHPVWHLVSRALAI